MEKALKDRKRVVAELFACIALVGCGGGNNDVGAEEAAAANASDERKQAEAASTSWTRIASEYQSFSVSGTKTVRYGADTRWVRKSVTGGGTCSNAFFGGDPAPGVDKICQARSATTAPAPAPSPAPTPAPSPSPAPSPAPSPSPAPAPAPVPGVQYGNLSGASLGAGGSLNGAIPFPASNPWNTDISGAPVDPNSANLIASIGLNTGLRNDFGSGTWNGGPIGIPYLVVDDSTPGATIRFTAYGSESDPGPYPIPQNAPIEGGPSGTGDRHVLVINRSNNKLYEIGVAYPVASNTWTADAGAVFDLASNTVRPGGQPGWTSADAAGLPIFPGLVRYDEASAGVIRHALRFTVQQSRRAYVPPATHFASSNTSVNLPPMGMRVRLKASYQIPANYSTEVKAILQALKTYGMFVADNGGNWYLSGAPDSRWNDSVLLQQLGSVKGSNFEVVRMDGLRQ